MVLLCPASIGVLRMDERTTWGPDPALFLNVFRASPIGIALEDLEGRPLFANSALCSMLGFSEEEMRSKHCVEFSPPEDAQKDWALFEQLRAGSIDHYQLEKRFFRRDGSLIRGRLSISLVGSGTSRLVVAMVEDLSEKRADQREQLRLEPPVEESGRFIRAQEEERTSIARELYHFIDSLTVLSIDLDRCEQNLLESIAKTRQGIREARQQVKEIVRDIGRLSSHLHSSKLELLGLAVAVRSFCNELSESQQVHVDFQCDGVPNEPLREISLCLYRILQEALQNAIKHSGSGKYKVLLRFASDDVQLIVRDWGVGFETEGAMKQSGLGLISMQERAKLVGGELLIESQIKQGTTIHVRVPLKT
jgi:PAS domain S-box-containing protein